MLCRAVSPASSHSVIAIELADRRQPGLNLYAVGDRPDRHEAFLDDCSAELVGRLEERGETMAA